MLADSILLRFEAPLLQPLLRAAVFEVDAENVLEYLESRQTEMTDWPEFTRAELTEAEAAELAWGVSNIVLRVDTPVRSFVVKQSRKQLRTPIEWFSQLERVWREVDTMRALDGLLPAGAVPRVLFEDRENYLFAMEAVEADHRVWKAELLDGNLDAGIATRLGVLLAAIHRDSAGQDELIEKPGDRTIFDELRLDPFYRYMAETTSNEDLRNSLRSLIDDTLARQHCLVLADFSPKNILLTSSGPVVVDFETAHIGDPGFDIGFFLSHVLLKVVFHHQRAGEALDLSRVFWQAYCEELGEPVGGHVDLERQCVRHLGACMLSRVDGKSRVDYLNEEWQQKLVREFCLQILVPSSGSAALTIPQCFDELAQRVAP